jgi:hypothetical protein
VGGRHGGRHHPEEASTLTATYCGRHFTDRELDRIRALAATASSRTALSRAVCAEFVWLKPDGGLKDMSCRVALLRMHRDGLITLPEPRKTMPKPQITGRSGRAIPVGFPVHGSRGDFSRLTLDLVRDQADSRLWNDLVAQYHYLGFYPLPGAQLRYFIHGDGMLLGVLGFGAAAWKAAPRDDFIGWNPQQRQSRLHLVVNNARFLVLPWVHVKYLASSALALAARQLPLDWAARYAYRPLLLESFVERERFSGTSYRAANWLLLGQTQGRGKLDRHHRHGKPVKDLYAYPLDRRFRQILTAPLPNGLPLPTHQTE